MNGSCVENNYFVNHVSEYFYRNNFTVKWGCNNPKAHKQMSLKTKKKSLELISFYKGL